MERGKRERKREREREREQLARAARAASPAAARLALEHGRDQELLQLALEVRGLPAGLVLPEGVGVRDRGKKLLCWVVGRGSRAQAQNGPRGADVMADAAKYVRSAVAAVKAAVWLW